jgi:hypothetical protein
MRLTASLARVAAINQPLFWLWMSLLTGFISAAWSSAEVKAQTQDPNLARRQAREQFQKNFREIQLIGQRLVREHEAGRLKPSQLAKETKAIQKCAKNLRSLQALGEPLAPSAESIGSLDSPQDFDQSIRRLAKLIYDYAHNPTHQNNRVFNTDEAARARQDLEMAIKLARALETKAKNYLAHPRTH